MTPTEVLMQEHRIIEQVLNCLEVLATQAESSKLVDTESAAEALDFFRMFADRCHHGKEEDLLFPMLEAKGLPREGGPTGVMLTEHDQGRQHVRAMADAIQDPSSPAVQQFIEHARGFVQLLRQHIQKEDSCLFSMANQLLQATDQKTLITAFEKVEHEDMGPETHMHYVELANQLADRLGVSKVLEASDAEASGCSHGNVHSS